MNPGTDTLQHEAGDRVHVLAEQFDRAITRHPFVSGNPSLAQDAAVIADALGRLYQAIWAADSSGAPTRHPAE